MSNQASPDGRIPTTPGFHEMNSWEEAADLCVGYEDAVINSGALHSAKGLFTQEQDYRLISSLSQQFLTAIAKVIGTRRRQGEVFRVLEFGGGYGRDFDIASKFFSDVAFDWTIIERAPLCAMLAPFTKSNLRWKPCIDTAAYDLVLTSGAIQYVSAPYDLLDSLYGLAPAMILNRVPIIANSEDVAFLQVVPPEIYEGSYPAWGFSSAVFLDAYQKRQAIIHHWEDAFDSLVFRGKRYSYWGFFSQRI